MTRRGDIDALKYALAAAAGIPPEWMDNPNGLEPLRRAMERTRAMLNVKGIDEAVLLAALYNAAKPDTEDVMYSRHESMTKEEAAELLAELRGERVNEPVFIQKVYGRSIYSHFWPGMKKIDGIQYDNDNGHGKDAEMVAALYKEIATKKNAERKAERAKRHRVAVYWHDDSSKMGVVADYKDKRCLDATIALLSVILAQIPSDGRDLVLRRMLRDAAALAEKYEEQGRCLNDT